MYRLCKNARFCWCLFTILAGALCLARLSHGAPPFHRFAEGVHTGDRWQESKQYVGALGLNVLVPPPETATLVKEVDPEGYIAFDPQTEFPTPGEGVLGYRLRIRYRPANFNEAGRKRKAYLYIPREELSEGPRRVRPPGLANPMAQIDFREVRPASRRYVSKAMEVPPSARLDFATGLLQDWKVPRDSKARFKVAIEIEGRLESLYDAVLGIPAYVEDPGWTTVSLDLGAYAGRTACFVFSTEAVDGVPDPMFAFPLWGDPVLYGSSSATGAGPNVLLISLDTLRADHLGCYGYPLATSPNLDRFAATCMRFEKAIASAPWTIPSHASLFTGLHPAVHEAGTFSKGGYGLDAGWTTLAEIMRRKGYLTAAFTEGIALRGQIGFDQGFDRYSNGPTPDRHTMGGVEKTLSDAGAWLERFGHLPFLLFVHTYEIHAPYNAPEPWFSKFADPAYKGDSSGIPGNARTREDQQHALNRYDAGIAYTDHHLGKFFTQLEGLNLLENTVVFVFSDHGEEFWEHGHYGHSTQVYDESLSVPLLVRLPGDTPLQGQVARPVALSDVFATVMELLGEKVPAGADSHSLLPLIAPQTYGGDYRRTHVVSEVVNFDKNLAEKTNPANEWTSRSLRSQTEKYLISNRDWVRGMVATGQPITGPSKSAHKEELYYLKVDPGETENLAAEDPAAMTRARAQLEAFLEKARRIRDDQGAPRAKHEELSDEDLEALRGLGYL